MGKYVVQYMKSPQLAGGLFGWMIYISQQLHLYSNIIHMVMMR